mmetsp:Transcript_53671/g.138750  ORF Transcript_53671/g.138750 Transcript_53671/m.138750 type:complete len:117 (-) Transcript_53671:849-1199(-)
MCDLAGCPPGSNEQQLRELFGKHGVVEEVFVMKGGSRSGMACAFVRFTTQEVCSAPWRPSPACDSLLALTMRAGLAPADGAGSDHGHPWATETPGRLRAARRTLGRRPRQPQARRP